MADLKRFAADLRFEDAATLLASGNLVFTAPGKADALEQQLEREAKAKLGLETDFLVRSIAELTKVIAANPFTKAARDHPSHLIVVFHREAFPKTLLATLADRYEGPERIDAHGRELYIDYPDGMGRSKLGPTMKSLKFPKCATGRNWNTVTKLAAMG